MLKLWYDRFRVLFIVASTNRKGCSVEKREDERTSIVPGVVLWAVVLLTIAAIIAASVIWPDFGLLVVFLSTFCFGFFGIVLIFAIVVMVIVKIAERKKAQEEAEKNRPDP